MYESVFPLISRANLCMRLGCDESFIALLVEDFRLQELGPDDAPCYRVIDVLRAVDEHHDEKTSVDF